MVEAASQGRRHEPIREIGLGVGSACLGTIALVLFFLPILSIPIALAGLGVGIAGIFLRGGDSAIGLRSSIAGVVLCAAGATMGSAIVYSSTGELTDLHRPVQTSSQWRSPTAPPPARLGRMF